MNFDINTIDGMTNAMKWQAAMLSYIRQGGTWIVPRSMSLYEIDHTNRVATKRTGSDEPEIERVFEGMGWRVVTISPDQSESPPYRATKGEG
jgi:hypothetical protein